jgi:hypothetical protein
VRSKPFLPERSLRGLRPTSRSIGRPPGSVGPFHLVCGKVSEPTGNDPGSSGNASELAGHGSEPGGMSSESSRMGSELARKACGPIGNEAGAVGHRCEGVTSRNRRPYHGRTRRRASTPFESRGGTAPLPESPFSPMLPGLLSPGPSPSNSVIKLQEEGSGAPAHAPGAEPTATGFVIGANWLRCAATCSPPTCRVRWFPFWLTLDLKKESFTRSDLQWVTGCSE